MVASVFYVSGLFLTERYKGRFGEVLNGIVEFLKKEELLPPKRLGSVVCIAVIERSLHAKARALACQICHDCIETIGLNGCGKKGVVAAAKAFSEEKVAEVRSESSIADHLSFVRLIVSLFYRRGLPR
jgi:hypothetical protein